MKLPGDGDAPRERRRFPRTGTLPGNGDAPRGRGRSPGTGTLPGDGNAPRRRARPGDGDAYRGRGRFPGARTLPGDEYAPPGDGDAPRGRARSAGDENCPRAHRRNKFRSIRGDLGSAHSSRIGSVHRSGGSVPLGGHRSDPIFRIRSEKCSNRSDPGPDRQIRTHPGPDR